MNLDWKSLKGKGELGEWRGTLLCREKGKHLWEVRQDWVDPRRLHVPKLGAEFAFDSGWESDGPSIPTLVCLVFGKPREAYLCSGFLHDDGYRRAGLWMRKDGETDWEFEPFDKKSLDVLLRIGVRSEGAEKWQEDLIYWGVGTEFGRLAWKKCRRADGKRLPKAARSGRIGPA